MSYQPIDPAAFAPTTHTHAADDVTAGVFPIARLTVDTPDGTKYLKDDSTLATPPTGGPGGVPDDGSVTAAKLDATDAVNLRSTLGLGALAVRSDVRLNQAEVTGPLPFSKLTASTVGSVLLGRGGASGAGDFQEIALGTNLSMSGTTLNASAGGGGVSDGDKGDLTVASSGTVWTIDNNVVTFAKLQDIGTSRVLGRVTASSGDTEELTASQVLDLIGSTRGSVVYRGASGWAALTPGTSGHVLKSNGAGADPSYAAVTASITSAQAQLGADVTMSVSNTWYQGLESAAAYGPGTYWLTGTITMNRSATTARTYQARLTNDQGSMAIYASSAQYMPSAANSQCSITLSAIAVVPALGSYRFRLYGLTTAGAATEFIKAALVTNGQGNNATTLTVVQLG